METLKSSDCNKVQTSSPSPLPSSAARLWRPAAQRNLRNQWPKLVSYRDKWCSISSSATSHATAIVNSHLSQRYMPNINLGVLSDMPHIRTRASFKLFHHQELQRTKLLLSYKNMVGIVSDMINASRSMRCYFKGANNSSLLQFSCNSEDESDSGDGGGIPVFAFLSIPAHEKFAEELVQMFSLELCLKVNCSLLCVCVILYLIPDFLFYLVVIIMELVSNGQRLLVLEFLSIGYDTSPVNQLHWSTQLYAGEFDDLKNCNLYCHETSRPVPPRLWDGKSDIADLRFDSQPNPEVLQVYLTTLLAEVNIDTFRVNEIFAVVGEEMHVNLC